MKILVIDDEAIIRTLAEKVLLGAGYEVIVADGGQRGLDLYRQHIDEIDLVLLDMNMNDLSGAEVLRRIRQVQAGLPVLISSGDVLDPTDISPQLQTNTHFLQKPYRSNELVAKVGEIAGASPQSVE